MKMKYPNYSHRPSAPNAYPLLMKLVMTSKVKNKIFR